MKVQKIRPKTKRGQGADWNSSILRALDEQKEGQDTNFTHLIDRLNMQ